jgi:hypothetical protein
MREAAQAHAHDDPTIGDTTQSRKTLREMNGISMTDRHGGTQGEFPGYRSDGGQYEQTFNVRVIGSLHRVGCKDQMISHPYRIETIRFGLDRAFEAFFRRSMLTKMRQHQAEFQIYCHGNTFSWVAKDLQILLGARSLNLD